MWFFQFYHLSPFSPHSPVPFSCISVELNSFNLVLSFSSQFTLCQLIYYLPWIWQTSSTSIPFSPPPITAIFCLVRFIFSPQFNMMICYHCMLSNWFLIFVHVVNSKKWKQNKVFLFQVKFYSIIIAQTKNKIDISKLSMWLSNYSWV